MYKVPKGELVMARIGTGLLVAATALLDGSQGEVEFSSCDGVRICTASLFASLPASVHSIL